MHKELIEKKKKLAVLGLGYVGLPIALEFASKIDVIGFDINAQRIAELHAQLDGITPPPRRHRAPMPPLSEITADLTRSA